MKNRLTLAAVAAAGAMFFATPQAANALPQVGDAKQATQGSNVEKAHYRRHRHRGWRHRYYRRHYYGYPRRYYRRPGFGIYLGF
jgi:hypothetical protein